MPGVLQRPVSQPDGLQPGPSQQPDHHQCCLRSLHVKGDEHRGSHFRAGRTGLPGLVLLGLPQAAEHQGQGPGILIFTRAERQAGLECA